VFNSGGSLTVDHCVVQNFVNSGLLTGTGIFIAPSSGTVDFVITNTILSNNGVDGILYQPPSGTPSVNGVIDHVVVTGSLNGIVFNTLNTTGGATVTTISNSIASNNSDGIYAINASGTPETLTVSIENFSASGNSTAGISATNTATVLLGHSVISGNSTGIQNSTSPNSFYTYGDNRINFNGNNSVTANVSSPLMSLATQ